MYQVGIRRQMLFLTAKCKSRKKKSSSDEYYGFAEELPDDILLEEFEKQKF